MAPAPSGLSEHACALKPLVAEIVAESWERSEEGPTPAFATLMTTMDRNIAEESPEVKCVRCKKRYKDPVWICAPCQVKKSKVLGQYTESVMPVRALLAKEARKKVKFDATQFITVKLLGRGINALRALHEVISDVDPLALSQIRQSKGKKGGQKVQYSFKIEQAEALHTMFSPAFLGVKESGFVALAPAGAMAFHPPAVLSVDWEKTHGSIPTMSLKVSSCCLTAAGKWRFTKTYAKPSLEAWRKGVQRSVKDAIGLILQGTTDAKERAALLTPQMRAALRQL